MMINASTSQDLTIIPRYNELKALSRVFGGIIEPNSHGWKYKAMRGVPAFTIQGAEYFNKIAPTTRTFENKTKLLTSLKLAVNNFNGEIIDVSQGVTLGEGYRYSVNEHGFTANHIPQMFTVIKISGASLVVTSITGNYDFTSRLFRGVVNTSPIEDLWKEQ